MLGECIDRYNDTRPVGEPAMTQARLADLLGVSQSATSLWVAGKRDMSVRMALRIGRILGCSVEDLFSLPADLQRVNQESEDDAV